MKIICIGRNYAEHANEMNAPIPTEPILFMKPETALLQKNLSFYYPEFSKDIHFETEIVLKISKMGRHIEPMFANRYYDEIGIGIDFTARDIQAKCKAKGLPWEISKSFDHSAPIGKFIPKIKFPFMDDIKFHLEINKNRVQEGNTKICFFPLMQLFPTPLNILHLKRRPHFHRHTCKCWINQNWRSTRSLYWTRKIIRF